MDLLPFLEKVLELKELRRTGWKSEGIDGESVADHSFSLSLLSMLFSRKLGLNSEKCIRMALVHDLCEIYSKDIPRRSADGKWHYDAEWKRKAEEEGMSKVLKLLPPETAKEIWDLWEEFNERKTPEAKLARDLDRLDCCLQALRYAKQGKGKALSHFFEDGDRDIRIPEIREVFEKVREDFGRTIK